MPKSTPLQLLHETLEAPLAYCSCKEALLARCWALLDLEGVFDPGFYERHLRVKGAGNNLDEGLARCTQEWAEQVIHDAIRLLSLPAADRQSLGNVSSSDACCSPSNS